MSAFKFVGGIEKVNKCILKALYPSPSVVTEAWGVYDSTIDSRYYPRYAFKGFGGNRLNYLINLIFCARKWDTIIVGHINLAIPIFLINLLKANRKIVVIAHGIEVWDKQKLFKKWLLKRANIIISVSEFTKNTLISENGIDSNKIKVVKNCLDPFFEANLDLQKPSYLLDRYNIREEKIILTISRINKNEGYKGYDIVIEALGALKKEGLNNFKYLLCGKYDIEEYHRLQQIVAKNNLEKEVNITGFLQEDELIDHYLLCDTFIMPSRKEGFGIVFIEAAACGANVIAGNGDGSSEALEQGKWGQLVDPTSLENVKKAILQSLALPKQKKIVNQIQEQMSFEKYCVKLVDAVLD